MSKLNFIICGVALTLIFPQNFITENRNQLLRDRSDRFVIGLQVRDSKDEGTIKACIEYVCVCVCVCVCVVCVCVTVCLSVCLCLYF